MIAIYPCICTTDPLGKNPICWGDFVRFLLNLEEFMVYYSKENRYLSTKRTEDKEEIYVI